MQPGRPSGQVLVVVFLGRRMVAGIRNGAQMLLEGIVGDHRVDLAMLNLSYELLVVPEEERQAAE